MEKKPLNIEIGQRVREARDHAGLSREKLAELVDVTPRFIADIERGSVGLSVQTLKSICVALKVTSDSIIFENNKDFGINELLRGLDKETIEYIKKTIISQLELIEFIRSKE